MTDRRDNEHVDPGVFDDDRLLACALGLDDDPELTAAAASDAALAERLAMMRAGVSRVGAQVEAAVPSPPDDYADLADPRWSGLGEYLETPRPARRRGSRWLRVLAPAAVVAVALAVGLAIVDRSADQGSIDLGGKSADSEAAPAMSRDTTVASYAAQVDQFATVVLARARVATGVIQSFVVIRLLKGRAPDVLQLRVAEEPADAGRLHLLFLRPLQEIVGVGQGVASEPPSTSPLPSPASPGDITAYVAAEPVAYSYQGETALARELPAGTDPNAVALP
jgi:hypothetical protein